MPRSSKSRLKILEAAARVVRARGAAALTYDELVSESGLTRGGITYHFPTKDALLKSLVERDRVRWLEAIEAQVEALGPGPATRLRAYVRAASGHDDEHRRLVAGMLSAIAHQPELLDGCRAQYRAELPAGGDWRGGELDALIVMLAADGLFWAEQFGFLALPAALRTRLLRRLDDHAGRLQDLATAPVARPRPSKPAPAPARGTSNARLKASKPPLLRPRIKA